MRYSLAVDTDYAEGLYLVTESPKATKLRFRF